MRQPHCCLLKFAPYSWGHHSRNFLRGHNRMEESLSRYSTRLKICSIAVQSQSVDSPLDTCKYDSKTLPINPIKVCFPFLHLSGIILNRGKIESFWIEAHMSSLIRVYQQFLGVLRCPVLFALLGRSEYHSNSLIHFLAICCLL